MGVVLYKTGDTHKVRGIDCVMQVFSETSYLHNLEMGWFYSPEECYAEEEKESEEICEEEKESELNIETLKDDEVRYIAQHAKISRWHVKAITTLKLELSEMLKA